MGLRALSLVIFFSLCAVGLTTHTSSIGPPPYRPTLPIQGAPSPQIQYSQDSYSDSYNEPTGPQGYQENSNQENRYQGNSNQEQGDMGTNYQPDQPVYQPGQPRVGTQPSYPQPPLRCSVARVSPSTIPRGAVERVNIEPLRGVSVEDCLHKCCRKGPNSCQYMWVFKNQCFSVACSSDSISLCYPQDVGGEADASESTYYSMAYQQSQDGGGGGGEDATQGVPGWDDVPMETGTGGKEHEGEAPNDNDQPLSNEDSVVTDAAGDDTTSKTGQTGQNLSNASVAMEIPAPPTVPTTPSSEATPHTTGTTTVATSTMATETPPSSTTGHAVPTVGSEHPTETLTIAVSGPRDITLPTNQVKLFASAWPEPSGLTFHWSRVFGRKEGVLSGMNDASVVLSELIPGVYGLKVTAESPAGDFGQTFRNVTVHDKPRDNTPPLAVISPSKNYTVALPQDTVIFDASQSTDDLGLDNLSFLWEQVTGPMDTETASHEALLTLQNPKPGKYRYKLTITDSDGAQTVAFADLKVLPERDYPPTANAGSDVVLKMPNSEVVLNGDQSSDDKPGLKYLWEIVSDQRGLDLEGTDSTELHVSKLTVGVYHFRLTVTDSTGQTDSSEVTVDVLPEMNEPPIAIAGGPYTVRYPARQAVLDGSQSRDDYEKGMAFCWEQTSGPTDIHLSGQNTSQLSISGLHIDQSQGSPTTYTFNLTLRDYANLTNTTTAVLTYFKDPKTLPHVSAGPDITITLPQNTAVLNGSLTSDDFGITSYQWTRSPNSPAAGIPLLDSDTKPVLILSNLVNGTYNFTLTVTNTQGVTAQDSMILRVLANPFDKYIVQLHLDAEISNFSRTDMRDLGNYLSLTLDDYQIEFQGVYPSGPHTVVEFYAFNTATHAAMNVTDAWKKLTENGQDYEILHYHVVQVEMKECQLSCSGHGSCDKRSKRCRCDVFWMENPIRANTGRHESNCEWSVFYVVLAVLGVLILAGLAFWLSCWCCLRKRRLSRTKRRIRYAIHDHNDSGESKRMLSQEGIGQQNGSLMVSESETEEEILFDSSKKGRMSPAVKNNKLNTEKYGKNSSLVNTVIPK